MAEKDTGITISASVFIILGVLAFALILPVIISGNPVHNPPPPGAKVAMILNLILFGMGWVVVGILVLVQMKWSWRATMAIVSMMILRIGIAEIKVI